ncbi:uncharacterized protein LOC136029814 isoform X2 [Artemia franciscana]|uniref:uncharacterized protein LOC136029814 isoform X2 n=1 Tax=Artemia franciscana TaxID=6661 RepID=UPI0032DAF30B
MKIHRDPAILKTLASFADISNGDSRAKIRRFKQEVKIPSTILILVGLLMLNVVCPIRVEKGKMVWPKLNPPTFRGLWLEPNKYLYPDCGITKLKTIGNGRKDKVDVNSMEGMLELHTFPEVEEASLPWMVKIFREMPKTAEKNETRFCGGTIISNRHVLTAAHCITVEKDVPVKLEDYTIWIRDEKFGAERIALHKNYVSRILVE